MRTAKFDVCIIGGCGHVGLPLAICFASKGKKVAIVDVSEEAIATVSAGKMPFKEEDADQALKKAIKAGKIRADKNPELISQSRAVVLTLGTPVSAHLYPSYNDFYRAVRAYIPYLRRGQLIIFRSTLFPGTTENIQKLFRKHRLGVDLVYCPERIAEGYALREIHELPQIISGFSERGIKRARQFFSAITKDIIVLSTMEAELAKLFTNVWRYIKFSIANQYFMTASSHGMDFYKIYNAMTYKYPRTQDLPRPGFAAGPCLFKDTMQLASFTDNSLFIGHAAMLINEGLPTYIISQLKSRQSLEKKTIGILGMAFKAESDDIRESLSYKLRNVLEKECKEVLITDPFVKHSGLIPASEVVKRSDIIIVGSPHKTYKKLKLRKKQMLVDVWNLYGKGCVI